METLRQFKEALESRLKKAIDEGDVFKVNEITANMMLGTVLTMMIIISALCLLLNEIGVFTADKLIMRWTIGLSLVVQVPIMLVNKREKGEPKWMKGVLEWGLLAVCAMLVSTLGHNVTLVMVIPVLLSIRYCDANFTRRIVLASIGIFALACVGNAYFGIVNLNICRVAPGTVLTVDTTLREAVLSSWNGHAAYLKALFIHDYLPRLMAFSVIGFSAIKTAERGRSMTQLQNDISRRESRIETELDLATEIQSGMLPCIFPAFPDHRDLDIYASNAPAKEVGGDFYDYFRVDEDHVAIVMADVSGKGVGAALFMTISKIVIKTQLQTLKNVAQAMTVANGQLCENNSADLFVTAWAGVYELSTGTITYVNAGHNPPVIRRKDGQWEYLTGRHGLVLAGMEGTVYGENRISLGKGDEIFLYTDGVTEATDRAEQMYGEDRLRGCLDRLADEPVQEQIEGVLADINSFVKGAEQFDDITMLAMKIK